MEHKPEEATLRADRRGLGSSIDVGTIADADLPEVRPGAVLFDLGQEIVDEGDAIRIERKADAVGIDRAKGLTGELVRTRRLTISLMSMV